ncbi:MAG: hypothetical protein LQ345_004578 [Seirophora villosa]|nr:MAG: hypothetical protein LQ345_004578 [Seirophora villosa]
MAEKIVHVLQTNEKLGAVPEWNAADAADDELVADKYQGTSADRHDMRMLGRIQVLRRNFNFIPILGFSVVLICTWELLFANLTFALTNGGTGGLFWGFTVACIACVFIYLSMAEMASMTPTAGGQYHWVSEFSPRWCQKYLSYITGWLLAIGWQGAIVGLSFVAGTIVQGLITLNNPNYVPEQWHGTLLVIAAVVIAVAINVFLSKTLPIAEWFILILHVVGLFAIIIPLLAMAPKNSARVALLDITNSGGWSTKGTSFMIGLLTVLSSMMGFDCAVHMSEEVQNASETLPKAILWGAGLNAVLGYLTVFTLCFTMTDIPSLLDSPTTFPFLQLFYNVTRSNVATAIMAAIIIITLVMAVVSEVATASRQIWAFSRDNGFPFSRFLRRVKPGWNIPLNALWVSLAFGVIIALINLGSSVALNAIVSLTISALISSYILSIGCLISRRLRASDPPLPVSKFSLGKYGLAINIIAMLFLVPFFIFCFFPVGTPVDQETMNFNVVMFAGITIFATGWYFVGGGREGYRPPNLIQNRDV